MAGASAAEPQGRLRGRLEALQSRIQEGLQRGGREPGCVRLVAVSKGQPPEAVRAVLALGLRDLGENYLQECAAKAAQLGGELQPTWHMLGHLQSNKAVRAAQIFSRVDSLDSLALARRLDRARPGPEPLRALCEVDFTGVPGRTGYRPELLSEELPELLRLPHLRIEGLMTVAAPEGAGAAFAACWELRSDLERRWGEELPVLSMGMSHDFEEAIAHGSTEVRIGTLLFGPRRA